MSRGTAKTALLFEHADALVTESVHLCGEVELVALKPLTVDVITDQPALPLAVLRVGHRESRWPKASHGIGDFGGGRRRHPRQ